MYVKKLASIVLSVVLAATTLASCGGRWDYSQEAAKAVNEAQGENPRVEFQVDQRFTDALHTAVNKNVQPEDVENAMLGDKDIRDDAAWQEYMDTLQSMGIEEAIAITQEAQDAFVAKEIPTDWVQDR